MNIEYTSIIFISVEIESLIGKKKKKNEKKKAKYPLNIFKARSASSSVAKTTVPKPLDLPSGPRMTSARMMVPACRNKSFKSCH